MNSNNPIIIIGNTRYCAYCGKQITPNENGAVICNCKDAQTAYNILKTAQQLEFEAVKLRNSIPKPRFGLQTVCAPMSQPNTPPDDDLPDPCI